MLRGPLQAGESIFVGLDLTPRRLKLVAQSGQNYESFCLVTCWAFTGLSTRLLELAKRYACFRISSVHFGLPMRNFDRDSWRLDFRRSILLAKGFNG